MLKTETILKKVAALNEDAAKINIAIAKLKKQIRIKCRLCRVEQKIGDTTLIQTKWYVPPSGCIGGDYWRDGEIQYVCGGRGGRNRIIDIFGYDAKFYEGLKYHFKDKVESFDKR